MGLLPINGILGGGCKYFLIIFTPIWGRLYNPFWRTYFSNGLRKNHQPGIFLGVILLTYNPQIPSSPADPLIPSFDLTHGGLIEVSTSSRVFGSGCEGWMKTRPWAVRPSGLPKEEVFKRSGVFFVQRFARKNLFLLKGIYGDSSFKRKGKQLGWTLSEV